MYFHSFLSNGYVVNCEGLLVFDEEIRRRKDGGQQIKPVVISRRVLCLISGKKIGIEKNFGQVFLVVTLTQIGEVQSGGRRANCAGKLRLKERPTARLLLWSNDAQCAHHLLTLFQSRQLYGLENNFLFDFSSAGSSRSTKTSNADPKISRLFF